MKKEIDRGVGLRIRRQREALGYSRERLSEISGLAVSFLGSIELGKCDLTVTTLKKLCASLRVSADYLLFGREADGDLGTIPATLSGLDVRYLPMLEDLIGAFVKTVALAEGQN